MAKTYNYQVAGTFDVSTTGNIDDLNFQSCAVIRMTNATLATIRGLKAGYPGQEVSFVSIGAGQVDLAHQNTNSAAANRLINFATVGNTSLSAGSGTATLKYDETTARWRLTDHVQGAEIQVPFDAANFTGSGGMTWTLTSGDQLAFAYSLSGRQLTVSGVFVTTSVTAPLAVDLQVKIPGGFASSGTFVSNTARVNDAGAGLVAGIAYIPLVAGGTTIGFETISGANWSASVNLTRVDFTLTLWVQ